MALKVKDWIEIIKNAQFEIVSSTTVFLLKRKQVVAHLFKYKADGYLEGFTIELLHFNDDKIHVEYVCYYPDGKSVHHGGIIEANRIEVRGENYIYIWPEENCAS